MADFKYAGFSGPHPSLVVECPTCGSPDMHYCNTGIDGGAGDRPHDARRIAAGTMTEPPDQTARHDGLGVDVWRWHSVGVEDVWTYGDSNDYDPKWAHEDDQPGKWFPTDAEALAEMREVVANMIFETTTDCGAKALNDFESDQVADAVLRALGLTT